MKVSRQEQAEYLTKFAQDHEIALQVVLKRTLAVGAKYPSFDSLLDLMMAFSRLDDSSDYNKEEDRSIAEFLFKITSMGLIRLAALCWLNENS
jgi:hypothetical protein